MKVLVCGGRNFDDHRVAYRILDEVKPSVVIHGAASGADTLADCWARHYAVPVRRFRADWDTHGRAAGPIRNQQMIDEGKPDLVLAFPGGRGTADMIRRARAAGITVREVSP